MRRPALLATTVVLSFTAMSAASADVYDDRLKTLEASRKNVNAGLNHLADSVAHAQGSWAALDVLVRAAGTDEGAKAALKNSGLDRPSGDNAAKCDQINKALFRIKTSADEAKAKGAQAQRLLPQAATDPSAQSASDSRRAAELVSDMHVLSQGMRKDAQTVYNAVESLKGSSRVDMRAVEQKKAQIAEYNQETRRLQTEVGTVLLQLQIFERDLAAAQDFFTQKRDRTPPAERGVIDRAIVRANQMALTDAVRKPFTEGDKLVRSSDGQVAASTRALNEVTNPRRQAAQNEADWCVGIATDRERLVTAGQTAMGIKDLGSQIETLLAALLIRAGRLDDIDTRNKQLIEAAKTKKAAAERAGDTRAVAQIQQILTSAEARQDSTAKEKSSLNNIKVRANDTTTASRGSIDMLNIAGGGR